MVEIIGHRGASDNAPENTLSSISEAWSQDADGVEVDVRLTKDLELVCIHDKTTLRTAGLDAEVSETTLNEIRRMDAGAWRGKEWVNEPIPLLTEVIELVPEEKKLFIEVKNGLRAIEPLHKILKNYKNKHNNIYIISFQEKVIEKIKEKIPTIKANLLISFDKTPNIEKNIIRDKIKNLRADGVGLQAHMQLTNSFILPFRENNSEVHVWTVDQPEQAKLYKEMGLNSITTNSPGSIKNYLLAVQ